MKQSILTGTLSALPRLGLLSAVLLGLGLTAPALRAAERVEPVNSMKVVFFTDIHARTEWDTPLALERAAEAINAQQADLVLCGGDMITDGYESSAADVASRWEVYRAFHETIHPEPVSVLGNHDLVGVEPCDGSEVAEDPRADIRAKMDMPKTYRSFDRSGYHFILLDSVEVTRDDLKYRGFINEEQMAWLRSDLAALEPDTPIVLVTHIPLVTAFYQMTKGVLTPVPENRGIINNREVLAAFENRRLLAVLQGHIHVNEWIRWRGISFITGGAISGKWWRGAWAGTEPGFDVLQLHPDRVDWTYYTTGWESRRPIGE